MSKAKDRFDAKLAIAALELAEYHMLSIIDLDAHIHRLSQEIKHIREHIEEVRRNI